MQNIPVLFIALTVLLHDEAFKFENGINFVKMVKKNGINFVLSLTLINTINGIYF